MQYYVILLSLSTSFLHNDGKNPDQATIFIILIMDFSGNHHGCVQLSGAPMELTVMRLSGDETLLTVPQVPGVPMGAPGMKL